MNKVELQGKISKIKKGTSQKGNNYFFAVLNVSDGQFTTPVEVACFSNVESLYSLNGDEEVIIKGRLASMESSKKVGNEFIKYKCLKVIIEDSSLIKQSIHADNLSDYRFEEPSF